MATWDSGKSYTTIASYNGKLNTLHTLDTLNRWISAQQQWWIELNGDE